MDGPSSNHGGIMNDKKNPDWACMNLEKYGGEHPTGISQTREFRRHDVLENCGDVIFRENESPDPITKFGELRGSVVLPKEFASDAQVIWVTIDIME